MNRKLSDLFVWERETAAVEMLDWASKEDDFARLCTFVTTKVKGELASQGLNLDRIASEVEIRDQIRESVPRFKEKHISIVHYCSFRLRRYLLEKEKSMRT